MLEPTYEFVVKHGSAFDSFQSYDAPRGHRATLIIQVDLPPPYRMFAAFAGSSAYSGTCERTPKRQVTAIIGRPFARTDGTVDMQMMFDAGQALGGPELVLLKHKRYEHQQEYRIIPILRRAMAKDAGLTEAELEALYGPLRQ